jgi:hypothetical protein
MSPSPSTVYPGVMTNDAVQKMLAAPLVLIGASGAIDPHSANRYILTKAGVAAMTLAAPTAGADDGLLIEITSSTANAHTVTATGLYEDGAGHVNLATFPGSIGGYLKLMAYNAKWYVLAAFNVTMT